MKLERYSANHEPELHRLLQARDMSITPVPKMGFAVLNMGRAAAMGFLREVEGGSYMFDSLISDPSLNSEQRHEAQRLLWSAIIEASAGHQLFGYAENTGTIDRALSHGFISVPHTILVYKGL